MKRGFTLIELLVVMAILAVLAVTVVLILNPAQLIRQARDSARISDMATLNRAIAFYLADVASPTFTNCFNTSSTVTAASSSSPITGRTGIGLVRSTTTVDGTGWVGIDFTSTTGGSPISRLPRDPVNSISGGNNYFYAYACDDTNKWYEIAANMESTRYSQGGEGDLESTDGGNNSAWYETGNHLSWQ